MRKLFIFFLFLLPIAKVDAFDSFLYAYGRAGDFREGVGLQGWTPFVQGEDYVTFGEARVLRLREQWNGAVGLGFRKLFGSCIGIGVNGFFDVSRADRAREFWQGCGGVEVFGQCWDLTAHYYYPNESDFLSAGGVEPGPAEMNGTQLMASEFLVANRIRAYRGFDVNAGLVSSCLLWGRLKGKVGYFRYTAPRSRVAQGPRFRLYYEVDTAFFPWTRTCWSIGGEWQYDRVRKTQAAVAVSMRFDLGCSKKISSKCCIPKICRRMNDPIDRELGITIIRTAERDLTDVVFANIFFVEQNGTGIGTQTDPTNLLTAEMNSQPGDFIFLLNDNGSIDVSSLPDDTFNMQNMQTLVSFANNTNAILNVGGSPLIITDLTGAGRGILAGATMPAVELANDNLVQGIGISGGVIGILGSGVAGATITTSDIVGATTAGARIEMSSAIAITDNNFGVLNGAVVTSNTIDLDLLDNIGAFEVLRSRFENSTGTGSVVINGGTADYNFTANSLDKTTTGRAIDIGFTSGVGGTVTFAGGSINTNGVIEGVRLENSSAAVSIANLTAIASTLDAVDLLNNTGSFTLDRAMISDSALGIRVRDSSNITIQNSTLERLTSSVPFVFDDTVGVNTISNTIVRDFSGANSDGFSFGISGALDSTINITNCMFLMPNTVNGIDIGRNGGGTLTANITNNLFDGLTGLGVTVTSSDSSTTMATITTNTFTAHGTMPAIELNSSGTPMVTFTVDNNTISSSGGNGIVISPAGTGGGQVFQGTVSSNIISSVVGPQTILFNPSLDTGDTFRAVADSNMFSLVAGAPLGAIRTEVSGGGAISSVVTNNIDSAGSFGSAAYTAETIAGFTDTLCVTFTGNSTTNPSGIDITNNAGTLQVADLPNLSTNNNGISVATSGVLVDVTSCPLPP